MSTWKVLYMCLLLVIVTKGSAQKLPILHSSKMQLDIRDGSDFRKGRWAVDPKTKPDVFTTVIENKYKWVTFLSELDSLRFKVRAGKKYPFLVVLNEKDTAYTEIDGIKGVAHAQFNKAYVKSHDGKSFIEIPKVYELFNIVAALTKFGRNDQGLIIKNTQYHQDLSNWFEQYKDEPIVQRVDSVLSRSLMSFVGLKMDAYAFEMSSKGKIRKSKVYDRISSGTSNTLQPFLKDLQAFSDRSKFLEFYQKNQTFYNTQIDTFRDSVGLPQMQNWLNKNFPTTRYNAIKVIFSPLVGNVQSATWLEDNGFREAQAHVNFPYRVHSGKQAFSTAASQIKAGDIVFTELNHCFINPEGEKPQYRETLSKAFSNLSTWNEYGKPAAQYYNNTYSCFNEYMNWALVSLRYWDDAPDDQKDQLIAEIENKQVNVRGFRKFADFNQYLLKIYRDRKDGQTISNLYPSIVKWFEDNK